MTDRTSSSASVPTGVTARPAGPDEPVHAAAGPPGGVPPAPPTRAAPRPRLSAGRELITMLLGFWLMIGLFVDGWAHNNLQELETFFTPWHALFYTGYLATGTWIISQVTRNLRDGRSWTDAVPAGYGLGLAGLAVFLAGGAGDMAWHTVFGIEQGIEALFSPTHLLLFIGIALILSSPLRAAWADRDGPLAPGYGRFLPVLLSISLLTTLVAFMFMYWAPTHWPVGAASATDDLDLMSGLATIFASNLILVAPLLLLARRWRPPLGTATTLYGLVAVLTAALVEFNLPALIVSMLVAGVAADALLAWIRPATSDPVRFWAAAAAVPLVTWSVYFATVALTSGIGWSLEMWTGTIMWAGLLGAALGLLMLPPRQGATT